MYAKYDRVYADKYGEYLSELGVNFGLWKKLMGPPSQCSLPNTEVHYVEVLEVIYNPDLGPWPMSMSKYSVYFEFEKLKFALLKFNKIWI